MALLRPDRPFQTRHTEETGFLAAIRKRGWNGSEAKQATAEHEAGPATDREKLLAVLRSRVSGHTEEGYDPYETTGELERREKALSDPAGLGAVMKERIRSIPERAQELAAKQAEPAPPATPRIARQAGRMAGAMREHLASEQERVKKAGFDRRLDIGIREYEERTKPEREKRLQEEREELEAIMSAPSGPRREVTAADEPTLAERTTDRDFYEQQQAQKVEPDQDEITTEEMAERVTRASPAHKPRGARRRELENRIEMHQALNERADKLDSLAQEMRAAANWSPADQEEVLSIMDEFLQRAAKNKKLKGQ